MTTTMTVDDTTWRFVQMLGEVLDTEPTIDLDIHEGHALAESALNHYEWQRQVNALKLLIGVRLTLRALNQLETLSKEE